MGALGALRLEPEAGEQRGEVVADVIGKVRLVAGERDQLEQAVEGGLVALLERVDQDERAAAAAARTP